MSLEVSSQKIDKSIVVKTLTDGQKSVSHTDDFTLECNGKDEAGIVSIRVPNHFIRIDLNERSVLIKDLGTEIKAR